MSYTVKETAELMAAKAVIEQGATPQMEKEIKDYLEQIGVTATVKLEVNVEGVDLDVFRKYADNVDDDELWAKIGETK